MTLNQIDPNKNKHLVLIYWVYSAHVAATIKENRSIQALPNNKLLTIKLTKNRWDV